MTDKPDNPTPAASLPEGWVRTTVQATGEYVNGVAFKPSDWGADGTPIVRIQNLTDPAKPLNRTTRQVAPVYIVRRGDLLVSWSATLDAFRWDRDDALLNQHIFKVLPRTDVVTPEFLFYLLRHTIAEMVRSDHLHGSTMQHINRGPFLGFPVAIPPKPVQVAIASRLDEIFTDLDAGVAALRRARAKLKRYRASVLKAAVEGRLTAEWREDRRVEGGDHGPPTTDHRPRTAGTPAAALLSRPGSRLSQPEFTFSPPVARDAVPSPTADLRPLTSRVRLPTAPVQPPTSDRRPPTAESGPALLARILAERRQRWEADQLAKFAKAGKPPPKGWQSKYAEPRAPDTANLPSLPEGWCWASIDQLSRYITSGSRDWSRFYGGGNGTFLMAQNVRMGRLDLRERQAVGPPDGDRDRARSLVAEDDLLVTIVGAGTGAVCRVPLDLVEHFVCQSVALIRPVLPAVSGYLEYFLVSERNGQAYFQKCVYGQGRPHLGLDQISSTPVPLPAIPEQQQIVAEVERRLSVADEVEAQIEADLKRASRLRQAILKRAFAGRLP